MTTSQPTAEEFLAACSVDPDVFELRPDYRAMLLVVEGIDPEAETEIAEQLLVRAEEHARALLAETPVEELPHIAAWREAYWAFGAKPQRTRNSLEALTRRAEEGLPRVNALTDIYNAVSVLHQAPLGGEEFSRYSGPARLARAVGDEDFQIMNGGEESVEHAKPGEVVWRDDAGITCRRWNWRQSRRTALTEHTSTAFFIIDALEPLDDDALDALTTDLVEALETLGEDVRVASRKIAA